MAASRRALLFGIAAAQTGCTTAAAPIATTANCRLPAVTRVRRAVARARTAAGKRTPYVFDALPPHPDLQDWPEGWECDCSGFIAWCFRLNRYPPELDDEQFFTDGIYRDAREGGRQVLFRQVATPHAGDVVVYPRYRTLPNDASSGDAGHIALITSFASPTSFEIIDCASSSWTGEHRDAIRARDQTPFTTQISRLRDVRRDYPNIAPQYVQDPIFARFQLPRSPV